MKYCPNCGKRISLNSTFCPYCGTKLNSGVKSNNRVDNYNPLIAVGTLVFDIFAGSSAFPILSGMDKILDNPDNPNINQSQILPKSFVYITLLFMIVIWGWTFYYYKHNKTSLPKVLKWLLIIALVIVFILILDVVIITLGLSL